LGSKLSQLPQLYRYIHLNVGLILSKLNIRVVFEFNSSYD
jgi:hypothetical protein